MRLQALCRSRILTSKFNAQRSLIINLQRYCRGFLVRRWAQQRMLAIIRIQASIRTAIQRMKFRRLKIEVKLLVRFNSVFILFQFLHGKTDCTFLMCCTSFLESFY